MTAKQTPTPQTKRILEIEEILQTNQQKTMQAVEQNKEDMELIRDALQAQQATSEILLKKLETQYSNMQSLQEQILMQNLILEQEQNSRLAALQQMKKLEQNLQKLMTALKIA